MADESVEDRILEEGCEVIFWAVPPPTPTEQVIFDTVRLQSAEVARLFAVPAWLIDGSVQPTQREAEAWRRTQRKDHNRARYLRRYRRGKR